jgi:hypothetical protein
MICAFYNSAVEAREGKEQIPTTLDHQTPLDAACRYHFVLFSFFNIHYQHFHLYLILLASKTHIYN